MTFTRPKSEIEPRTEDFNLGEEHLLHGAHVTVVFPCLNEELAVGLCVERALGAMNAAGLNGSVLVVDNGSTDGSERVAAAAGAQVIFQQEPGYGAALRSGFEAADSEYVIMADADGTYELEAIPRLLMPLVTGEADMVLGQRLNDATTTTMPWLHRYVGTPAITFLVKKATKNRIAIRDSQSGFRAFRREQVLDLKLSSTGMEFASEMLIRSSWANMRIQEVDTKYAERIGESKLSTFSDGLRHLRQIMLLSPETAASVPGVLATVFAVMLWALASFSVQGFGQVGSLSWFADLTAGVLSILGPLVFCTGIVLRYRAESLGLRQDHVKTPLPALIHRFTMIGVILVCISVVGVIFLLINFHQHPELVSRSVASSLASFIRSSFIVGIVLAVSPLIAPFLLSAPRQQLPIPLESDNTPSRVLGGTLDEHDDPSDLCLDCLRQRVLRQGLAT